MTRLNLPVSGAPAQWFSGATPGTTLYGTTGNDQLAANASNMTLVGNGGDDTFIVYDPGDVVVAPVGSGISTVETWGSGYSLPANVQNLTLEGSANAFAVGNSLDNIITANAGSDTLDGGGGDDLLVGGSGDDTFVVRAGYGNDEIANFRPGSNSGDVIDLQGFAFTSLADIRAAMTQSGPDTVLNLGGGQSITFDNTAVANFTADNFNLPFSTAGLTETFDDEFNSISLNTGVHSGTWKTSYYFGGRTLPSNGELEEYMDPDFAGSASQPLGVDPFSDSNGTLTITARPTNPAIAPYIDNMPYTSGLLTTEDSFAQTYGYWEIRAQLPKGDGLWPGFWLLPADRSYPPEVDILEVLGNDTNTIYNSFHGVNGDNYQQVSHVADLSSGFHTFGFAWTPSTMTWYVDGLQTAQRATPAYMNKPMYMLINLAVGGDFPGAPDASTPFPASLNVDYARAYSLPQTAPAMSNPAGMTAELVMEQAHSGALQLYALGGNTVLGAYAPGQLDTRWQFAGMGAFTGGDTNDLLLSDGSTGDLEVCDIQNNQITGEVALGAVGLEWQVLGVGDFSGDPGEADLLMRDANNGALQYFDIQNNQVHQAGPMGAVGMEWQILGFGDFSGNPDETNMLMRDTQNGALQYFDIKNNQVYAAGPMGAVGLEWQVVGFGDISGNANETDMLMRDTQNGAMQYFDIRNNQVYAAGPMGAVGTDWQSFGIGAVSPSTLSF